MTLFCTKSQVRAVWKETHHCPLPGGDLFAPGFVHYVPLLGGDRGGVTQSLAPIGPGGCQPAGGLVNRPDSSHPAGHEVSIGAIRSSLRSSAKVNTVLVETTSFSCKPLAIWKGTGLSGGADSPTFAAGARNVSKPRPCVLTKLPEERSRLADPTDILSGRDSINQRLKQLDIRLLSVHHHMLAVLNADLFGTAIGEALHRDLPTLIEVDLKSFQN